MRFDKNCYNNEENDIIIAKYDFEIIGDKYISPAIKKDIAQDNKKEENNENNIIINKSDKIKDNFNSRPHIGLANIDITCYMNATL